MLGCKLFRIEVFSFLYNLSFLCVVVGGDKLFFVIYISSSLNIFGLYVDFFLKIYFDM